MADAANPEGGANSPLGLREAADRIKAVMQGDKPQANQPDPTAKEANSQPEPEAKPEKADKGEEPEPRAELKPERAEVEESEPSEAESSEVELADTPQGLAEQLGVPVDQLMEHVKVTVKIDGVEKQVNLNELAKGYQLESDYRKKTIESAETRRKADEAIQAATMERQHIAQNLAPLIQAMRASLQEESRSVQALLETDPGEYLRQKARLDQKQQMIQVAEREQWENAQRQQQEFQNLQKQAMVESERMLLETFPDWKGGKGQEEIRALRSYAKEMGVNPKAADTFFEAPFFKILHDAREYRKQQASKPAALKKIVGIPKVQKPGAAGPSAKPEVTKLRVATDRLRQTGHIRDAVPAMKLALKKAGIT